MTILEEIRQLEEQLEAKRRTVAATIYAERHAAGLSLTQVARTVRVSAPTVREAEKGIAWSPRTVSKLLRYFERRKEAGKANGQSASAP